MRALFGGIHLGNSTLRVLRRSGESTGSASGRRHDLLIAAHAYTTGATIVTSNTDGFKRIRGLKIENWLA